MNHSTALVLSCGLLLSSACELTKSATPLAPTKIESAEAPAARSAYPGDGPGIVAYVAAKYPEKLVAGISPDERLANMQFLRDRVIEIGKCAGLDLGWNLKRGGPDVSNDFIAERVGDSVLGHDIAVDYDNTGRPLQLYWGSGDFPTFKEYPQTACQ
jgi:hypothetical protein